MKASFWQRYFSFSGRIKRLSFFLRVLFLIFTAIGLILVSIFIATLIPHFYSPFYKSGTFVIIIFLLIFLLFVVVFVLLNVAWYSLGVQRLHDMGYSGLWMLGSLILWFISIGIVVVGYNPYASDMPAASQIISLIQLLYFLVLCFSPGAKGPNRFGQDPKWGDQDYAEAVFGENSPGRSYHQKQQELKTYQLQEPAVPQDKDYAAAIMLNGASGSKGTKLSVARKPKN